jgi:RNA polymerase sigma-70 factor (ECF subfamily)
VRSYSAYNDQELVNAIRHDDEAAFAELFNRYGEIIYKMAFARVKSKEVSEEIVQNIFIALWDRRDGLSINNVSSYFFVAVKHRVLNFLETRIVQQKYWEYYKKFIPHEENETERAVEFNELLAAIEERMQQLPEKSKRVFALNRLEGRSIAEIARTLNLSEKAIEYHLTRSLKELRLHLKDYILFLALCLPAVGESPVSGILRFLRMMI